MTNSENTYHREDLRRDLLRAGRDFIAANGHHTLSVRTLAQAVGVSPGAPYHHFRDRRSLLLALALDGYADLFADARRIAAVIQTPEQTLVALGLGFLEFATSNPHLLDLMYESELTSPSIDPALLEYQHNGQDTLMEPLRAVARDCNEEELSIRVLSLWSTIYGFASLRKKRMIKTFVPSQIDTDEIARRTITLAVHAAIRG